MKRFTFSTYIILAFFLCAIITNCTKENQSPSCEITTPVDLSDFIKGDTITIIVEANDPDGQIKEVVFSINSSEVNRTAIEPYSYDWISSDDEPGIYVIKAKAIDNENKEKEDECSISIITIVPEITTKLVTSITGSTAISGGVIVSNGGSPITNQGICWSENTNPIISDNHTSDDIGEAAFISNLTNLSPNTTYNVRSYATNNVGTAYGDNVTFTSIPPEPVTDFEGNTYSTVTIGTQLWMAENLRSTVFSDGTSIPLVEDNSAWDALVTTDKAYCFYDNITSNGETYGALYTWAAAMNGGPSSDSNPSGIQGVCPTGWHLPSNAEWTILIDYLGSDLGSGGMMKQTGTTLWKSPNAGATNESGFSAVPGGYRNTSGFFTSLGNLASFKTATESGANNALDLLLFNDSPTISRTYYGKRSGESVRCIKDN